MPARLVVVHEDLHCVEQRTEALVSAGWHAKGFADSMAAVEALDEADKIDLLIRRVERGPHNRMAYARR